MHAASVVMSRHTNLKARTPSGAELSLHATVTDAPILPIEQIRELQRIVPDRVQWLFEQTEREAEFRRKELRRTNTLQAVERASILSVVFLLTVLLTGAALWAGAHEQKELSIAIGCTSLIGVVGAILGAGWRKASVGQAS